MRMRSRITGMLFVAFMVQLVAGSAWAVEPVVIQKDSKETKIGANLEYFEDEEGILTLEDAVKLKNQNKFIVATETPNFGFSDSNYWIYFTLQNNESESFSKLLQIAYGILDSIDFYFIKEDSSVRHVHLGDGVPFKERIILHRTFLVPLELKASETLKIYLKVQTTGSVRVPIVIWDTNTFFEEDGPDFAIQGFYFGLVFVMALYNLFVYFNLRERSYLYYVVMLIFFAGFQGSMSGLSFQFLLPTFPWWATKITPIVAGFAVASSFAFTNEFLELRIYAKKIHRIFSITTFVYVIVAISSLALPISLTSPIMAAGAVIGFPILMGGGILRWRQGSIEARYYTLAFASLIFGSIIFSLTMVGIVGANFLTTNGPQIGSAIEVVLLSLGLARKLKTLTDENLRMQKEAAANLEREVEARTRDLEVKTLEAQEATQEALHAKEESDALRMVADNLRQSAEAHSIELEEIDKQKTHFFQNISHELRTPLTLILNPLQVAEKIHSDDKNIEVAAKNSRRLLRLVNQLLDFQKLEAGKKELQLKPVNMVRFAHVCGDYFASACSTKNIEFQVRMDGEQLNEHMVQNQKLFIQGEIDALEKVAFNFLSNALKYTPEGGDIELGIKTSPNAVRIYIQDSGPGISEEGQQKLFQVFSQVDESTTRAYEGTGLGLALVKDLAEAMEGKVGVNSIPGEGATFWGEFPRLHEPKPPLDLLIVDDEVEIRKMVQSMVRRSENIESTQSVGDANEARMVMRSRPVKCVLCDYNLPMEDGVSLLQELAQEHPNTRRVLITGGPNDEIMQRAVNEAWVHQVFFKPVDSTELIDCLDRLVGHSPIEGGSSIVDEDFAVKDWLLADARGKTGMDDDEEEEVPEGSGELVLVVDDLPDMRDLIAASLEGRGYRTIKASNGKRGLEKAQKHNPDLIITDWMMPVMSGPDLIKELKNGSGLGAIPVVLLTAKSDEESKLIGTGIGADAFLGKPFNDEELSSTVHNLLKLKTREREVDSLNKLLTENVLKRYLPPTLVDDIVAGRASLEQEPKTAVATILFSDLSGFTQLTSKLRAGKMARLLNEYLAVMTDVIYDHGGTIDKFIGDAIMVIFGAPVEMSPVEQAERASQCGLAMYGGLETLNKKWSEENIPEIKMRVGIHQGPVVVGTFGGEKRSDYTAIGPTVNVASRIETACTPGEVFISGELFDCLPETMAEDAGEFELKGMAGMQNLFRLVGA